MVKNRAIDIQCNRTDQHWLYKNTVATTARTSRCSCPLHVSLFSSIQSGHWINFHFRTRHLEIDHIFFLLVVLMAFHKSLYIRPFIKGTSQTYGISHPISSLHIKLGVIVTICCCSQYSSWSIHWRSPLYGLFKGDRYFMPQRSARMKIK